MVKSTYPTDLWNPSDAIAYLTGMRLSHSMPGPRWNPNVLDANRLFYALWTTALFLLLISGGLRHQRGYALNWRRWGNHPREWAHWTGVFTYPFLHRRPRTPVEQHRHVFHAQRPAVLFLPVHCGAHGFCFTCSLGSACGYLPKAATTSVQAASITHWRPSSSRRAWSGSPNCCRG